MLCVENLEARYGAQTVITGLSFTLGREVLAVLGPSGCGKTTLINLLAGVLKPEKGRILFDGSLLNPHTVSIGLIPQSYGLLPWKTVRQNCLFCAEARGQKNHIPLRYLAEQLGLTALLDRYPRQLSGGQAQRAALARALLTRPRLLLLDEPFSALDLAAARRARTLCLSHFREASVLVVTHRIEDALYLADRIGVMADGGRFGELLENPFQGVEQPDTPAYFALAARLEHELLAASGRDVP